MFTVKDGEYHRGSVGLPTHDKTLHIPGREKSYFLHLGFNGYALYANVGGIALMARFFTC